jgi:hypothetical protein
MPIFPGAISGEQQQQQLGTRAIHVAPWRAQLPAPASAGRNAQ